MWNNWKRFIFGALLVALALVAAGCGSDDSPAPTTINNPDTVAPSPPTNLAVSSVTSNTVTLTWAASTDNVGVAGYYIYRNSVRIGQSTSPVFTDVGLTANTQYTYQVKAFDAVPNLSDFSNSITITTLAAPAGNDTTAPSAPANLSASATVASVVLTWTASTDNIGVTNYFVYRIHGTENVNVGQTTTTTFTDTTVIPNNTYTYLVKASDAANNLSDASNVVQITTPAPTIFQVSVSGSVNP